MANTGIILRRNVKDYFNSEETKPIEGEIVYATDTQEYGILNDEGGIDWSLHGGYVQSINGRRGEISLTKQDVGLHLVDNTSDLEKPISNATNEKFKEHFEAINPHRVTPHQIGLGNVNNTSDIEKPISRLTQDALDLKVDKNSIPVDAKFTDTTYEIKDGELSEYNFSELYKEKLDYLSTNSQLLSSGIALSVDGRTITLTRADGTEESIETQDTIYNDSLLIKQIANILDRLNLMEVTDDLDRVGSVSTRKAKEIVESIEEIKRTLFSDNVKLDTIKEIVDFIEANRHTLDSLTIDVIPGLREELSRKVNHTSDNNTVHNSTNFDNHSIQDFMLRDELTLELEKIRRSITAKDISNFITVVEAQNRIQQAIDSIDYQNIYDRINSTKESIISIINSIDLDTIRNSINSSNTSLTEKINEVNERLTLKTNKLNETLSNIDVVQIDSKIENLKTILDDVSNLNLSQKFSELEQYKQQITQRINGLVEESTLSDKIKTYIDANVNPQRNQEISSIIHSIDDISRDINDFKQSLNNSDVKKIEELEKVLNDNVSELNHNILILYSKIEKLKNFNTEFIYTKQNEDNSFSNSSYVLYKNSDNVLRSTSISKLRYLMDTYSKSESDSRYMRIGYNTLPNDNLTKSNLLDKLVYQQSSNVIDFDNGVNFYLNQSNAGNITFANYLRNKGKSGLIHIKGTYSSITGRIMNESDIKVKTNVLFSYYINPIDGGVILVYVGAL